MPLIDLPLAELKRYSGRNPRPVDFDAYWAEALRDLAATDPRPEFVPNTTLSTKQAECFDLWFTGVGGARVYAKFIRPRHRTGRHPAVLNFHGYGAHSGDWITRLPYVLEGACIAAMDCRGQGGRSSDPGGVLGNTSRGQIIRGIDDPDAHKLYFRQVFLDTAQLARIVHGHAALCLPRVHSATVNAHIRSSFWTPRALCGDDLWAPLALDFLTRWPELAAVQRAKPAILQAFYATHNSRRQEVIAARIALVQQARPLTFDRAVIAPAIRRVQLLVALVRPLQQHLLTIEADIAAAFAAHPEADLFAALPGAGPALAPVGRIWHGPHALSRRGEPAEVCRRCAREGTERPAAVDPLALERAQVPAPDLRRVGRPDDPQMWVGQGLLPPAKTRRQTSSDHLARPRVQMDPHPLALLARP